MGKGGGEGEGGGGEGRGGGGRGGGGGSDWVSGGQVERYHWGEGWASLVRLCRPRGKASLWVRGEGAELKQRVKTYCFLT